MQKINLLRLSLANLCSIIWFLDKANSLLVSFLFNCDIPCIYDDRIGLMTLQGKS